MLTRPHDVYKDLKTFFITSFQGYDIKHIFQKSILTKEQTTRVLEAIRLVYPNYEAEVCEDVQANDISPLVSSLYTNNKTNLKFNAPKSLVQEVMKSFEEQLEQENVGFGTIRSVERKRDDAKGGGDGHKSFLEIQSGWKESLTSALQREIELVMAGNKGGVFLNLFSHLTWNHQMTSYKPHI